MANFTGGKLANNEGRDFTHVFLLTWEDLKAIGNGGQETLFQIPAGGAVELVMVDEAVAVTGTTTLVIDIGTTTNDPDEFINALDVDNMTVPVYNTGDAFEASNAEGLALAGETVTAANVVLEVTDANIATITAGEIIVGVRVLDPRRFSTARNG